MDRCPQPSGPSGDGGTRDKRAQVSRPLGYDPPPRPGEATERLPCGLRVPALSLPQNCGLGHIAKTLGASVKWGCSSPFPMGFLWELMR